jgi:hypothetical protein
MTDASSELTALLERAAPALSRIGEAEAAHKPSPDRWSKKEILGHLIDSAGNNHQRFVRAQFVLELDSPNYDQEFWVAAQAYATEPWTGLVTLWVAFNRHLAHVLRELPESALPHQVAIAGNPPLPLSAVIEDYLRHLEHHLDQILS